ncbi:MAG TPA: arsenite methyltransferase [Acidimicrobiales bacterium]
MNDDDLVASLQHHYGEAARRVASGGVAVSGACEGDGCCGPASDCDADHFGAGRYDPADLEGLPPEVAAGSIGCANPVALADLHPGQDVLDLGSGGGIDVLLSARRVAPTGRAYGLDMNPDMLALARENQRRAGVDNVEFLEGRIEDVPLPDGSVDVVLSNCVINLSADKDAVLAEAFRVLRPAGRLAVADVVADREPDPALRADPANWATCTAGALTRDDYRRRLTAAGVVDVDIADSHEAGEGFTSVLVRARRP